MTSRRCLKSRSIRTCWSPGGSSPSLVEEDIPIGHSGFRHDGSAAPDVVSDHYTWISERVTVKAETMPVCGTGSRKRSGAVSHRKRTRAWGALVRLWFSGTSSPSTYRVDWYSGLLSTMPAGERRVMRGCFVPTWQFLVG